MSENTCTTFVWVGATLIGVMLVVGLDLPAFMLPVGTISVPFAKLAADALDKLDRDIALARLRKKQGEAPVMENATVVLVCAE